MQLATNGTNIVLDILAVLVAGLGVRGVAGATLVAEWAGLALGLWCCRDAFAGRAWRDAARVFDMVRLRAMAVTNSDIMIRSVLLLAIMESFVFVFSAGFGDVTLAANQILMQFLSITSYALDGMAFAAEALVGQAMGARRPQAIRQAACMTGIWGLAGGVVLAAAFALAGGAIIDLMTNSAPVRAAAREFLPWLVAVPVLGAAPWMLDGIFIGATRTRDMRNMAALSALIYGLAVAALLPLFGNHGLWAALCISFLARGATLAWRYPALERAAA